MLGFLKKNFHRNKEPQARSHYDQLVHCFGQKSRFMKHHFWHLHAQKSSVPQMSEVPCSALRSDRKAKSEFEAAQVFLPISNYSYLLAAAMKAIFPEA